MCPPQQSVLLSAVAQDLCSHLHFGILLVELLCLSCATPLQSVLVSHTCSGMFRDLIRCDSPFLLYHPPTTHPLFACHSFGHAVCVYSLLFFSVTSVDGHSRLVGSSRAYTVFLPCHVSQSLYLVIIREFRVIWLHMWGGPLFLSFSMSVCQRGFLCVHLYNACLFLCVFLVRRGGA